MDYPHRGPNISRIRLEGAGGFIYALTPVLIALFVAPGALLAVVAAGALIAPFVHARLSRHQAPTRLGGAITGFATVMSLAFLLGDQWFFRAFVGFCVVSGFLLAFALHARVRPSLSIRR
jgi:hypothetical protein